MRKTVASQRRSCHKELFDEPLGRLKRAPWPMDLLGGQCSSPDQMNFVCDTPCQHLQEMLFGIGRACGVVRVGDQKHSQALASDAQVLISCSLQLLVI